MSATPIQRCDQCGQFDDHPKVHAGDGFGDGGIRTTHLDCLSVDQERALRDNPHFGDMHGEAIDLAKGGTRGDELRAHMVANVLPAQAEIMAEHDRLAAAGANTPAMEA
jgi:hypothetical protein